MPLSRFHPLVQKWFAQQFAGITEPQLLGWPAIQSGEDVLISAPTGSGKTLAAFLHALDQLVRSASAGELADETRILYVSPLKALSNDVRVNLLAFCLLQRLFETGKGLKIQGTTGEQKA